jgi:DNA-directed RNA polymerase specialized sigma24 family protein
LPVGSRPAEELDRAVTERVSDVDVWRAVSGLSESHRSVVILRFWLDWDVDRVAHALDIAPGTVRSRTHRALRALERKQEVTP